jgi:hypothetical protein
VPATRLARASGLSTKTSARTRPRFRIPRIRGSDDGIDAVLYPRSKMTKEEFTDELCDHLPPWIQVGTDVEREELDHLVRGRRGGSVAALEAA